jgi:Carboxypeptidase regulatory-like domain
VKAFIEYYAEALIQYESGPRGETVKTVYRSVYAPGETDIANARTIDLNLGTNVSGIDISLAQGRNHAVRVKGTVTDAIAGKLAANARVQAVLLTTEPAIISPSARTNAVGEFEIDGLSQGSYLLVATVPAENNSTRTATQTLAIGTADVDGVQLSTSSGFALAGKIQFDGGAAARFRVTLRSEFRNLPVFSTVSDGSFSISGIPLGNYRVSISPAGPPDPFDVESIRLEGVETKDGWIRVNPSTVGPLDIVIGRNPGIVEGAVVDASKKPAANVLTVLIPVSDSRPELFKFVWTDVNGHFQIKDITPGNYLAYSWPWAPDGIWQNADFRRSVERQGQRVAISEGKNADIELQLIPEIR